MSDLAIHRFVWGYGESGYAQLAQNAELPDALSVQARAVIDRCHFSENRPGLLLVPIERSAYLLVARVRLISPEGDQRPYWERAVALVPLERLSEAAPSFAALLSLLPDFGARGVLSPDEVAVQKSEPHEPPLKTPTIESALQRLWCAVHLGLQTVLTHGTEDAELALCANLWNKLWPDKYKTLMIALGLELPPRRGELTCIYSAAHPKRTAELIEIRCDAEPQMTAHADKRMQLLGSFYVDRLQTGLAAITLLTEPQELVRKLAQDLAAQLALPQGKLPSIDQLIEIARADRIFAWLSDAANPDEPSWLLDGVRLDWFLPMFLQAIDRTTDTKRGELTKRLCALCKVTQNGEAAFLSTLAAALCIAAEIVEPPGAPIAWSAQRSLDCPIAVHNAYLRLWAELLAALAEKSSPALVEALGLVWEDAPNLKPASFFRRLLSFRKDSPEPPSVRQALKRWIANNHQSPAVSAVSPAPSFEKYLGAWRAERLRTLNESAATPQLQVVLRGFATDLYAERDGAEPALLVDPISRLLAAASP